MQSIWNKILTDQDKKSVFIIGGTTMIYELIGTLGTRAFYTVGTVENRLVYAGLNDFYLKLCGLGHTKKVVFYVMKI